MITSTSVTTNGRPPRPPPSERTASPLPNHRQPGQSTIWVTVLQCFVSVFIETGSGSMEIIRILRILIRIRSQNTGCSYESFILNSVDPDPPSFFLVVLDLNIIFLPYLYPWIRIRIHVVRYRLYCDQSYNATNSWCVILCLVRSFDYLILLWLG